MRRGGNTEEAPSDRGLFFFAKPIAFPAEMN